MKRTLITMLAALTLVAGASARQAEAQAGKTLDIYVPDTEGGGATLFVTPAGESVLIDAGNPGERDHGRLMEVIKAANLTKLDYVVLTHYHVDHIGGLQQLAAAIPIGHYIDHGPSREDREQVQGFQAAYAELHAKAKHTVVKPGDKLPIAGLEWTIVAADGETLAKPLPGAGQANAAPCAASNPPKTWPPNDEENARSVGSLVRFGQFKTIHLGDLFWAREMQLMCPVNRVGTVDLYLVTHHGLDASSSPALVHALRPRVALMQNGTRKGGGVGTNRTILSSPGIEDLWQLHWSYSAMVELNPPGLFIANLDELPVIAGVLTAPPPAPRGGGAGGGRRGGGPGAGAGPDAAPGAGAPQAPPATPAPPAAGAAPAQAGAGAPPAAAPGPGGGRQGGGGGRGNAAAAHTPAHFIKVSAQADGTFTVTNSRNDFSKTYTKR
jgi:beta-lactamase superfamily II metal-dependent hydrolase